MELLIPGSALIFVAYLSLSCSVVLTLNTDLLIHRLSLAAAASFNAFLFRKFRFSFTLEKTRELEIDVYWRDWRSLCAVKFLRLEEFVDDLRHGMALQLEPQGLLFAEVGDP